MITYAMNSDVETIKNIWKTIFHDEDWYLNDFFNTYFIEDQSCLLWKSEGEIIAMLHMLPFQYQTSANEKLNVIYLYALATLESCRGKGIMDALIKKAVSDDRSGKTVYMLVAASDELTKYYEKRAFIRVQSHNSRNNTERKNPFIHKMQELMCDLDVNTLSVNQNTTLLDEIKNTQNKSGYHGFLYQSKDILFYLRTLLHEKKPASNLDKAAIDQNTLKELQQDYLSRQASLAFSMLRTQDTVLLSEKGIVTSDLWMVPL